MSATEQERRADQRGASLAGRYGGGFRYRTPEAADYLGLSASSMEKMRLTGDGPPYYKLGKICIYEQADLDAWARSRRQTSTSQNKKQDEKVAA
jgi:Helix-turn-helix domain